MTRKGEQEFWSVSGRLPDNPGELADAIAFYILLM